MVQPNVNKRPKNNSKEANATPAPQMPQLQTIMAVVVPVELYEQMKRHIRAQPFDEVDLLMTAMKNLQPQQVNMTVPGQG